MIAYAIERGDLIRVTRGPMLGREGRVTDVYGRTIVARVEVGDRGECRCALLRSSVEVLQRSRPGRPRSSRS